MAMMTFSLGGLQQWIPTFLSQERGFSLESANLLFGMIIVVDGIFAALIGGWLGDYLLPRMKGSYYFVSAVGMALGVPAMIVALNFRGRAMVPAICVAAFFLLLREGLSRFFTEYYLIPVGVIFVAMVIFMPQGLLGFMRRWLNR